ncbi:hypothetical protein [Oscillibacter sp.]|uniref:ORC-CDC6 family AAA ATPase n=1 Tax=Oscillibacter sp. TaxID=1945593 RepID=UPI0028A7DD0A|nr:hypothetical protein [Oscillibacter sp.]
MHNQFNPFKENRTEQMRDLWKYYVPFPGLDGAGKPIVVQGGRGSGKTMFFQCNSWRQVLSEVRKSEKPSSILLDDRDFIGIYYRVDTTFVSSMRVREEAHWDAIFETYFSICILQDILDLVIALCQDMPIDEGTLTSFVNDFARRIYPESTVDNVRSFRSETEHYLDMIEDKINGVENSGVMGIRWVKAHRFISDLCESCNNLFKRNLLYKVFIDEYETLQEYQQKIINTLIKHSTLPVIFNIGLRPKGMKTKETISKTETIEAPHDYEFVTLGIDSASYQEILKEICRKRIALAKEQGRIPPNVPENIEYYLGTYSIDYELQRISQAKPKLPHIKKLNEIIRTMGNTEGLSESEINAYCEELSTRAPVINSRLHYALLCKQTAYTPALTTLCEAYTTTNSRYNDWMHNRKHGLIYLLCKETKREKMYYGFDVFAILSSNIVRYFLELCEQTFKIAFLNGYAWETPINPEVQTEAARYVSEYKIVDIAGYEPYGNELRLFIQYLGQIFYRLHTGENNTLGEPEPNHFNTKDLSLPEQTKRLISSAIMWNVLQEGEPTKRKQSKLSPETVDYYLNKIYVPYFGISYRNQRKIQIEVDVLKQLLSGNEDQAKNGFRSYFKMQPDEPVLNDNPSHQISLFDHV